MNNTRTALNAALDADNLELAAKLADELASMGAEQDEMEYYEEQMAELQLIKEDEER